MKLTRLLRRLAVVVATVLLFAVIGIPTVSAADIPHDIGLGSLSVSANGSYIVTGAASGYSITVTASISATITLKSVLILASTPIDLQPGASVTLLLDGTSTLIGNNGYPGILVPPGASLFIAAASAGGSLEARGGDYSAGIGGGALEENCGSVNISGGTVQAYGGLRGAGIGSGNDGNCNSINISGGSVTAKGGECGAGIGGGYMGYGRTVNISGGTVVATGGDHGAGIGGGYCADGNVNISGGTVTANGGLQATGIGGGDGGNGGTVNIYSGTVTANGGPNGGAGIGSGCGGNGGIVNISGGTVTANGSSFGAGIGGSNSSNGNGGTVTISGGNVTANGGTVVVDGKIVAGGVGIGGGPMGSGGAVILTGPNTFVTAKGGFSGLDIGAGLGKSSADGGTLSVQNGAHLTLLSGLTNILPTNVTISNDCTVDGTGAGSYKRTHVPPVPSEKTETASSPVFLRSTSGSGVEIDVSALALPAGVTLISQDFTGLPTQAAGKTWTLSHKLAGTNGTFQGKDYLALYDFTLTDETGKLITGYLGRLTVRLPIPSGSTGKLHVLYYDESGKQFTEVMSIPDDKFLTYSTTHLSHYLVTSSGATGEKPAIPETGAPEFSYAAAGGVLLLTLFTVYIVRKKIRD